LWSATVVVPAAAAVGFVLILLTPAGGWGYIIGPVLAAVAILALVDRLDGAARLRPVASVALLAAVVTLVVMAVVAAVIVAILGL
jgi:hypothetical protein